MEAAANVSEVPGSAADGFTEYGDGAPRLMASKRRRSERAATGGLLPQLLDGLVSGQRVPIKIRCVSVSPCRRCPRVKGVVLVGYARQADEVLAASQASLAQHELA